MASKRTSLRQRIPIAIDLFSGCGGLSTGLKQAGFRVRAAVEIDTKAQQTYRLNHPAVKLYGRDIRKLSVREVMRDLGLSSGELDLLAGCPPCQGFSRLRTLNQVDSVEDPRNNLVQDFLRFVRVLRPKTVMLENVPALENDERFVALCKSLSAMKYQLVVHVLNAADYSVAQRRKRLILLASKVHVPTVAPKSEKRKTVEDIIRHLEAPSSTGDALHAVPERRSEKVMELIRLIPRNGGSRTDLPIERQLECHKRSDGFHDVYGRMAWNDLSPTITSGCINPSKGRFLHPTQDRTITLREAALLQGFPPKYKFDVSHGKEAIALMIGNALPPPFIAAHARALRQGIFAGKHNEKNLNRKRASRRGVDG
ncbi:DNA cytosine methyltransferase [Paraburkholderia fungorum]|uniref:DNA cytosine methyltransferase n=1 Tax=Paraburkholderia fungorum TaxID=134537 RepID=UPI001C1EAE9D|nr:DNA cytosine methyltransferase [Paraburkholderia fungorum]MBU7438598.1 DNA cytosine methyltransferase [Paraburkholderia fungorum]